MSKNQIDSLSSQLPVPAVMFENETCTIFKIGPRVNQRLGVSLRPKILVSYNIYCYVFALGQFYPTIRICELGAQEASQFSRLE